jgi:CheY-like chemotaxis protein/anti-sigma regulatory factor (Ser/Thr protein kinase)
VIGDILDFSKIEAKEIDCTTIDFDLRTTMDEIKKILLPKAGRKGLGLVLSVHQQVPSLLKGDPEKLRQILTCLLANAVKFTDRGEVTGSVVILQENPTHAVLKFEVSDTGIGMEPDRLNTIFESFPGVPGSGAGKYWGTGIGLSIVSRLVHAMEGTIEVKSRPGKGTVFGITLNFEKQPALLNTQINIPRTIKGKKILIVDDDGAGRIILKEQLKKWGCLYDEAASAERALEKISSLLGSGRAYDIVLIDMQLPGMGGETLAGKIKSMPQGADMVLIMLSATGRRGDAARLEKTGVDGYLPKPPEASMLFNCITTALAMGNRKEKKIITRHLLREILKQRSGILMVELGSINRKMVKNILNKSGYTVGVAENRTRAGEIFKTGGFNIVLLEAGLVDREVFKTAEMIRRIEKESKLETTVIFVMADPGMTIETGPFVDEVIPKPVTADHLLGVMEKWRVRIQGDSDAGFRNSGSAGAREKKNIFNIDAALERAMEDKAFLEMLVNEFVRGLPEKLAAIKTSILKKDTGTLILQVHSLRGSALNLGAGGICSAALELEKKGDVGDLETIHEKFERLAREFHRFEDHIKTICWSDV